MVGACSSNEAPAEKTGTSQQQTFSDEDKRIARLLSVGSDDIDESASPQYRATLCSLALQTIEERMRGALSDEQRQAFAQAQSLYDRRARTGVSAEDQQQTRDEIETAYPDESDRVRFAIGCLQDLA
ncbi:MAG: hypothetical protein MK010_01120 [Erythrobacter sp.]|nr:hypothetical protein [Erythrobacter sp.]